MVTRKFTKALIPFLAIVPASLGCDEESGSTSVSRDSGRAPLAEAGPSSLDASPGAPSDALDSTAQDSGWYATRDDALLSQAAERKVRDECRVFTAGRLSADYFAVRDLYERCVAHCLIDEPCEAVRSTLCRESGAPRTRFEDCVARCDRTPADGFACGDGQVVTYAVVCDLKAQCKNGADQDLCAETFLCASGESVPVRLVCDGLEACADGSDEGPSQGCARCAP